MQLSNTQTNIVGTPSGYIPAEYPKAMSGPSGKTTLARNPDHQAELEESGWVTGYVAPPLPPPPVRLPASSELQAELLAAKSTINGLVKELMEAATKHDAVKALWVEATAELATLKENMKSVEVTPFVENSTPSDAAPGNSPAKLKIPLPLKK